MNKYNGKLTAILGTTIIHLLAAIIFMSFKLQELKTKEKREEKFKIEFAAIEEKKPEPKRIELPPTTVENILHDDAEMLNIARNMSSKSDVKIDAKEYINQVKNELIQSGQLSKNNYMDAQNNNNQSSEDDQYLLSKQQDKEKVEEKPIEAQKKPANFQGPTRIYYDLQGRNHTYLSIPIYKCQGSGKVVLEIEVNPRGLVEKAGIIDSESTTSDECLGETAIGAALRSRFEALENAPKIQKGTLTYIFVAQ